MNKKCVFILIGALFLLCGVAHADLTPIDYYQIWMTNVDQVTPSSGEDSFDWDETPYLYIEIRNPENAKPISSVQTTVTWTWKDTIAPIVNESHVDGYFGSTNAQWIPYELTETGENWSDIQKAGSWEAYATSTVLYADGGRKIYSGKADFNVNPVPEPLSCLLFLAGGIPFLSRLRKKA